MFNLRTVALAAALAITGAAATAAPNASAKGGPSGVRVSGVCTKSATAELKLTRDDGRVQVEFEVDQNRNSIPWNVTLRRNGSVVASSIATTRAPSGSFTVRRMISGAQGTFVALATRPGERCTAHAAL